MAGMFGIGLSGLNTAQAHLTTVSHNIANAGTPGYSRQSVAQIANDAEYGGVGFFGRGVQVGNITRAYNSFLDQQVQSSTARQAQYSAYNAQVSQINNLLADPEVGLSPVMNAFFAAVQDVVANPTSVPARQALLSNAESAAARFRSMDARLQEIAQATDAQIEDNVARINSIAQQIADLNERIALAGATGSGVEANDLEDQRNGLLGELNSVIRARGVINADGQMSVFIGTGQSLVLDGSVQQVTTMTDPANPERVRVGILTPSGVVVPIPEQTLTNGALGGLLDFRRESLDTAQRQMDLIARSFIESVNGLHRLGVDLEGRPGGELFGAGMVRGVDGAANPPVVSIENDTLLTNDSYSLVYGAGGDFELRRRSDNQLFDPADVGLNISVPPGAVPGEEYRITPLAGSARDISVLISDPSRFAAGLPQSYTATASFESLLDGASTAELDLDDGPQFSANGQVAPFTLRFDSGQLSVDPGAGYTLSPDAGYDAGLDDPKTFTLTTPTGEAFNFTLSGAPVDGDAFEFGFSIAIGSTDLATGPGDNRNAVAIGALQTTQLMSHSANGTPAATLQSAYSQLVSFVGNKTREVQTSEKAQAALLQQATDARESFSGVNLDEEAANLVRYQQAYQASARVMTVAQRLFDEVISFGR